MYQVKTDSKQVPETALEVPGVTIKVLHRDNSTGAMGVLTTMAAGAIIPAHFHTSADETVYILTGDFVEDGQSYGPGSYFAGKAGTTHGPHRTVTGCTMLTHFSAELDFQPVEGL